MGLILARCPRQSQCPHLSSLKSIAERHLHLGVIAQMSQLGAIDEEPFSGASLGGSLSR